MKLRPALFFLFVLGSVARAGDWTEARRELVAGNPMEQQVAMMKFRKGDRTAVPVLIEIIKEEKDPMAKARAGESLGHLFKNPANRDSEDIAVLGTLADSDDHYVAEAGLGALANFKGDERAKQHIRHAIAEKKDDSVRGVAIGWLSLASGRDGTETEFIKRLLKDKSDFVRVRAASSLGRDGKADGISVVLELLRRTPSRAERVIISEAAMAAGVIGDRSAIPELEKIAASKKEYGGARFYAMTALKAIELKGIAVRSEKISFLTGLLAHPTYQRWATGELLALPGPDTTAAVQAIADDASNAGQTQASRIIRALREGWPR